MDIEPIDIDGVLLTDPSISFKCISNKFLIKNGY